MAPTVRSETRDGVRVLHMEFGRANALGPEVAGILAEALGTAAGPTVLTGEGRVFSAGLDLVALDGHDRDDMEGFVEQFSVLMTRALTAPYPLVAAVNGHAVAGGCVLALACDHRVGVDGPYKVGMNEMAIGLTLPAVVTEIIRGRLSAPHARRVILGGALYAPTDACDVGLLDELAPTADDAITTACSVAASLGRSPREFAAMKGSLVSPIVEKFRETRGALDRRFLDSWFGEEATRTRTETIARLQRKS